jgi:hypothetical protein
MRSFFANHGLPQERLFDFGLKLFEQLTDVVFFEN